VNVATTRLVILFDGAAIGPRARALTARASNDRCSAEHPTVPKAQAAAAFPDSLQRLDVRSRLDFLDLIQQPL